ncbi:MAG: outer membrane protein assembly factor BamA [Pseudomonadota bacterium]|jgi:outer membrane protein insertion porin family
MPKQQSSARVACRVLFLVAVMLLGANAVGGVLTSTPVMAQGATIRDIKVEGNRRIEPETVRSYLAFSVGDRYDSAKGNQSIKALFATGLFADVQIDNQGAVIVVAVVENPVVNKVAFEGNSEIDNPTLAKEVRIKPRSVYTRSRALADVQRILDVYRRQGRYAASVEPKLIELEQNRVNVVFEINEGNATKVKSINFIGNQAFSDSQLRDVISTSQSSWLDWLKGAAVYDPDRFNLDRELLRQYYLKNGYADVRVVAAGAELDRDGSGFIITFTIDEGPLYKFGEVRIESALPEVRPEQMGAAVLTHSGQVYNASNIDKTVEALTLAASQQGQPFARTQTRVDRRADVQLINLVYIIDQGPRVYIERINIAGNVRTKDHVIRREFRLAEGDAYNPFMVDKAKKRLRALGFFKSADVRRRPGSGPDRVVLDVVLEEKPTGELSFGAGYSTVEGVIGDIKFEERNLMGNGQYLRLRLGGSVERAQIDLSFTEPRFLDRNIAAGFDLFHKELDRRRTSGYRSRKSGGGLRMGFPLADKLWLMTNYQLSRDDIYQVEDNASVAIEAAAARGAYITSSVGMGLTYDTRNHPRSPNQGIYLSGNVDFAGVGGDAQYVRVQGEARAYYPITTGVTLVGRAVGGHIEGWGGEDLRLLDLFYKGGETIRGFGRVGIGPRDLLTRDALGGQTFWAATAEIRYPIPLIPEEYGISGAVFADVGSVFGAGPDATKFVANLADDSLVRASVGASIMWNSPLGPLRLDYAHALNKADYDKIQEIRFGASTKF